MEEKGETGARADKEAFERYLSALRGQVGDAKYKSWFLDLALAERTSKRVTLSTPSESKRDILDHRYLPILAEVWRREIGPVEQMRLTVRAASLGLNSAKANSKAFGTINGAGARAAINRASTDAAPRDGLAAPLDPQRVFETLAVGDSNRVGFAAVQQTVAEGGPSELAYLYGDSGVGKTHLLHAACHAGERRFGEGKCLYVTNRNLINACVNAVLSKKTQALHDAFLEHDIVAFDDVHLLDGKDRTQQELLTVIDALLDSGKSIVIAGDMAPAKLVDRGINKRLADRLAGGLCAPVHPADEAMRLEILKKRVRSSTAKCLVTEEALQFIARNFAQSTREAIGALKQILLMNQNNAAAVDLEEAKALLKPHLQDRLSRKAPTIEDAIIAGAEAFGLTPADITGRAQPQRIVRARHAIVFCCREVLGESFPRIGKALKRDHTTVMSSYRRAQALIERDKAFQAGVNRIREALEG